MTIEPEVTFEFNADGDLVIAFDEAARQVLKENWQAEQDEYKAWEYELRNREYVAKMRPLMPSYQEWVKDWQRQAPHLQNDISMFVDHIEGFLANGWSLVDIRAAGFLIDENSLVFTQDEVTDDQGEYLWLGRCYRWNLEAIYSWVEYMIEYGSITLEGTDINMLHIPGFGLLTAQQREVFDDEDAVIAIKYDDLGGTVFVRNGDTFSDLALSAQAIHDRYGTGLPSIWKIEVDNGKVNITWIPDDYQAHTFLEAWEAYYQQVKDFVPQGDE